MFKYIHQQSGKVYTSDKQLHGGLRYQPYAVEFFGNIFGCQVDMFDFGDRIEVFNYASNETIGTFVQMIEG